MLEVTYYFNAYTTGVWTDPDNIVDNNLATFGYTNVDGSVQVLTGNSCPGTDLGTIAKVELRVYGHGDSSDRIDLTPVFSGGDGDEHQTTPEFTPGWSAYIDITSDTNAEDWAEWSDIQGIDVKVKYAVVGKTNNVYCAKVEIRVTYAPPGWSGKVSGVTNPAKVMGVDIANINKVKGVVSA